MPKASIGKIVKYRLSKEDAISVNKRRTSSRSIAIRMQEDKWPLGAQAHIGNLSAEGDEFPMIIVAVYPHEFGQDIPGVNGQVFLDGNDTFWVNSVREGQYNGQWHWPGMD